MVEMAVRWPSVNATTAAAFEALPGGSASSTTMTQRSGSGGASMASFAGHL
jgi:hypothetical protein